MTPEQLRAQRKEHGAQRIVARLRRQIELDKETERLVEEQRRRMQGMVYLALAAVLIGAGIIIYMADKT